MNETHKLAMTLGIGLGLATATALAPANAHACGGFFCDGGPQPMPVDQTGEDILFVIGDGKVEAHIRIEYEGEAENFAWVIPVLSIPSAFHVGSEPLFDNIKAGSVPTYGVTTQSDPCAANRGDFNQPLAGGDQSAEEGDSGAGDGPTIYKQETVGAFEITVLGDGSVEEVMTWLADNGYQQDPEAEPILAEYLAEGHYFAALKLTAGAEVEALHPIALEFEHSEPCVPLRLTRIAATEDMEVRTYFLGQARVVPANYRHVLINPLKIDWPNQAANYKDVIGRAVDAEHADGRAFVTEYAGPSAGIDRTGLVDPRWTPSIFVDLPPVNVPDQLVTQGLLVCDIWDPQLGDTTCAGVNPMVDVVLAEFLPVPAGVSAQEFYGNTSLYADLIDTAAWDGQAFADRLVERVIEPGQHAAELLDANPYLTRMYTIISPHEMIADPMFHENPGLAEVEAIRTATQRILCSGDSLWSLPDGRQIYIPPGEPWPNLGGERWYEEEVQEVMNVGAEIVLVNNTEAIEAALEEWNDEHRPYQGCGCTSSPRGPTGWGLLGLALCAAFRRRRRTAMGRETPR